MHGLYKKKYRQYQGCVPGLLNIIWGVSGLGVTVSEGTSLVRFQWEGIGEETDC